MTEIDVSSSGEGETNKQTMNWYAQQVRRHSALLGVPSAWEDANKTTTNNFNPGIHPIGAPLDPIPLPDDLIHGHSFELLTQSNMMPAVETHV